MLRSRKFQASVVAVLLVLLVSPAAATCCAWLPESMPCCEMTAEGFSAPCCMTDAGGTSDRPIPTAGLKRSGLDSSAVVATIAQPAVLVIDEGASAAFDRFDHSPGSNRLYLRLSAIRR